jgi:hypothetical protein
MLTQLMENGSRATASASEQKNKLMSDNNHTMFNVLLCILGVLSY